MAIEFASSGTTRTNGASSIQLPLIDGRKAIARQKAANTWHTFMLADSAAASSGKWMYEISFDVRSYGLAFIGLGAESALPAVNTAFSTGTTTNISVNMNTGEMAVNGALVKTGVYTAAVNHLYHFAIYWDADARKIWVRKDGAFLHDAAGDPLAGTNEAYVFAGATALEPMFGLQRVDSGVIALTHPDHIQYPVAGFTPFGYVPASITFAAGAVVDAAGAAVTEAGVIVSVCDRTTGVQIAATTVSLSAGGGTTATFAADVVNGQSVVCHLHNASGTFKSYGQIATVTV